MKNEKVQEQIRRMAAAEGVSVARVHARAVKILDRMGHNCGGTALKFLGYTLQKVMFSIYQEIMIEPSEVQRIVKAIEAGPVLILPNHRSYMDFLVISFFMYSLGVPVPAIAAGEDFADMSFISWFLRGSGAFFMPRSFKENPLYWVCFSTYVDTLISNADMPMEFFVEGTRARPGKSLHPKVGLLGVAVRPFLERRVGDILLIPIAVTYEQRMETHLYAREMLGIPKPKEGLGTTIAGGTAVVKTKHGRMHCKVGEPISARARAEGKVKRELGTLTPGEGKPYDNAGKLFIEDLAYEVVHTHQKLFVVTVPSIFASLVMMHSSQGATTIPTSQLLQETEAIAKATIMRGHTVDMHLLDNKDAVCKSVQSTLLADLHRWVRPLSPAAELKDGDANLAVDTNQAEMAFNTILLAHGRNELLHVFAVESLVVLAWAAVTAKTNLAGSKSSSVGQLAGAFFGGENAVAVLFEEFKFMLQLLYSEVVLPVRCEDDERKWFDEGWHRLAWGGHISVNESTGTVKFTQTNSTKHFIHFLSTFLSPYVHCVSNVAAHFAVDGTPTAPNAFLKRMHKEMGYPAAIIGPGCTSPECLSQDTLKNSLEAMERFGIITKDFASGEKQAETAKAQLLSDRLTPVITVVGAFAAAASADSLLAATARL